MNLTSERNKPIFVTRPVQLTALNAIMNEAVADHTAIRAKDSGDFMVKAAAARRLPSVVLVSVGQASPSELKELVVSRLQGDVGERFRFLDGREFTGPEAAQQVTQGTAVGKYFLELETETLRIVQDAFQKGELT